jgi:hypothetical protein
MKQPGYKIIRQLLMVFLFSFMQLALWAQDSASSSVTVHKETTTTTTSNWYAQPWVWIVGGAVFILILIALLRGNSSSTDKEVSRTTVIKDREI